MTKRTFTVTFEADDDVVLGHSHDLTEDLYKLYGSDITITVRSEK